MKRLNETFNRHWLIALMLLLMLLLAGCSSSDSTPGLANNPNNPGDPIIPDPGNPGTAAVTITGTVIGEKAPVAAGAASITARITSLLPAGIAALLPTAAADVVPLAVPTAVILIDETGKTKSQIVTEANGAFAITVPTEHSYVLVFREENEAGKTIGALTVNSAGRMAFSLPKTSAAVLYLGAITIDPNIFKAVCANDVSALPPPTATLPDTEGFGFPDITGVLKSNKIPTDGAPSPLFGAGEFEQQMILFEEFGTEPMPAQAANGFAPLPQPVSPQLGPDPLQLESFLAQTGLAPYPQRVSNTDLFNPWKEAIEAFLGRMLMAPATAVGVAGPIEGRPGGEWWAHQKWDEMYPQVYYKTAQAGARVNGGFRDARQRHGYSVGEFGPGGLYNTVYTSSVPGAPTLVATTNGLPIQIHPKMPVQSPQSVWTFDGTLPPKLLMARYGQAILMRHYNALPIDTTANRGFGRHTISTHEHNGHSPGESDGFAGAFYFPGQFWDYRWPLQLAGYDLINTTATEPRAAFPCSPGETLYVNDGGPNPKACVDGRINIRGDWRETMSTHWFHDHMLDHTAENVYKGNAVMMNYYSALDRGNESINDGINLRFPSGTALSWGNRDYDINLVIADKAWDAEGQLWFSDNVESGHDGFIGDRMLTNWLYKPYFDVRARSYRFRILNGAVSRYFVIALVHQVQGNAGEIPGPAGSGVSYNRIPFHMIANDGNIMEHAIPFDGSMDLDGDGDLQDHRGQLPSQAIAERYDIVVDFSKYGIQPGDKLYLVNLMEHQTGRGTKKKVALPDVLSEKYKAELKNGRWVKGDPAIGKFLELRVHAYTGQDLSMNPANYVPGAQKMIPLAIDRNDPALATAPRHTFEFVRSQGGGEVPWKIRVDGGDTFPADPHRISALMRGDLEIWSLEGNKGWSHPVHIHFEEGIVLSRGKRAPDEWEKWARKDVYRVGPEEDSDDQVVVAIRARDFVGTFVEHCHNTMHEDHAMLLRWDAMRPDQLDMAPTPMPSWDGVAFEDSTTPMPMVRR